MNGKVYAVGGHDSSGNMVNTLEVYDPNSNSWASSTTGAIASMRTARYGLAAAAINGKIYAIGGFDGRNYLNTVEVYDPGSNSWSTAASMPTARSSLAAADASGLIYAVGGIAFKLSASSATEQYSPPVTIYTFIKN